MNSKRSLTVISFFDWIAQFRSDLNELERCSSVADCKEKLKKMFGENIVDGSLSELSLGSSVLSLKDDRFNVAHRDDPGKKWTMAISSGHDVNVRGYIKSSESRSEEFFSDCPPLDKNIDIYFVAKIVNIAPPYEVNWQIVNTGHDAAAIENGRGLRGGFDKSSPPYTERRNETKNQNSYHCL